MYQLTANEYISVLFCFALAWICITFSVQSQFYTEHTQMLWSLFVKVLGLEALHFTFCCHLWSCFVSHAYIICCQYITMLSMHIIETVRCPLRRLFAFLHDVVDVLDHLWRSEQSFPHRVEPLCQLQTFGVWHQGYPRRHQSMPSTTPLEVKTLWSCLMLGSVQILVPCWILGTVRNWLVPCWMLWSVHWGDVRKEVRGGDGLRVIRRLLNNRWMLVWGRWNFGRVSASAGAADARVINNVCGWSRGSNILMGCTVVYRQEMMLKIK